MQLVFLKFAECITLSEVCLYVCAYVFQKKLQQLHVLKDHIPS